MQKNATSGQNRKCKKNAKNASCIFSPPPGEGQKDELNKPRGVPDTDVRRRKMASSQVVIKLRN